METARQVASLAAMRCDQAQGFYFSKPLPGEEGGARGDEPFVAGG